MALTAIEQVKVLVGDIGKDSILSDDVYQHFLDKNQNNTNRASVDAAKTILYYLASFPVRERTGDIEVWRTWASSYRDALKLFLKEASLGSYAPIAYAGGVSKSDMLSNHLDPDVVQKRVYKGMSSGVRPYNKNNDTRNETTQFFYDDECGDRE